MQNRRWRPAYSTRFAFAVLGSLPGAAAELEVTGTPCFFVNGRFLRGAKPFQSFKELIDEELARKSISASSALGDRP